ncbi:MAG: hypothetical protein ACOC5T_08975 [Elusimicrobiota bacterium]
MNTNFLGLEIHCTDEFINEKVTEEEMNYIRGLYDKSLEGNEKSLYHLLDIIHELGYDRGNK